MGPYIGQPIAIVVAADRAVAEDGADRLQIAYQPLPPVMDLQCRC